MSNQNRPRRFFRISTMRSVQSEVDDEMRFHIQSRVDALMLAGSSRADAESIALREFGDLTAARAQLASIDRRRARRGAWHEWLTSLAQDVRFGVRALRSRPAFALTTLITLALGIGGNAAIYSVVYAVLLKPLPFKQPERLVHLWEVYESNVDSRSEASYPDYLDWRSRNHVFADLAGYHGSGFLLGTDRAVVVPGGKSTWNFFDVLGVRPLVGRTFARGEDDVGAPRVALLTFGIWQTQFAGDRGVIGRTIMLDGAPATVIGVLPRDFQFAREGSAQIWTPLDRGTALRQRRGSHWLKVVARLRDGVTLSAASSDMSVIMRDLAREYPESNAGRDSQIVPLRDELVGSVRPLLLVLYGAVAVVLLVACANVANLLLMRGTDRQREIAVRVALGAGRGRLVRQLLTESMLLSIAGATLGLVLAQVGVRSLLAAIPMATRARFPALLTAGVDANVVVYSIVISIVAGLAFGLAPALRTSRTSVQEVLRNGGRGSTTGASLREALVVAELSLTLMLLCGATLFGRSLARLLSLDLGFRAQHVTTAGILLPKTTYGDKASQVMAFARIEAGLRSLPGVTDVGLVSKLPLDFGNSVGFDFAGRAPSPAGQSPSASYREVAGSYFKTLDVPLMSGRAFDARDAATSPAVGMVNREFAVAYFQGKDPVGASLLFGPKDSVRIVGMVGDGPIGNVGDKIPPTLYLPLTQSAEYFMSVVIRGDADAKQLARAITKVVTDNAPGAAVVNPAPMDQLIAESSSVFMRRFPLLLVGVFAGTALILAVVGIYGVVSYSVAQRSREMGIRLALGAQPRNLVSMIVREGGWLTAGGVLIGVVATLVASRFVTKMLYGVAPSDPATYVAVSALLAAIALVAMVVPARRASRVDPAVTLRGE
ncbi:MAG: ADOP family duplicated permease [Gemmatimonas sp.]